MRRTLRRAPDFRATLEQNRKDEGVWAKQFGKELKPAAIVLPPKRTRAAPDPEDTEAPVLAAVSELLRFHPQVLIAVRQNSGGAQTEGGVPIFFYRLVKSPPALTITDLWGFLRDGRPFAFEAKRPSWKSPRTDRELKQQAFIHMIESIGGIGGFVRSVDEAKGMLP